MFQARRNFGTGQGTVGHNTYFGLRCFGAPSGLEVGRILSFMNPTLYIPWSAIAKIDTFPSLLTGRKEFETDMQALMSPEFQRMLLREVMLNPADSLASVLQPETYRQIDEFLSARGLSIGNFERLKPSMVSISLSVMEMKRLGLTAIGVDQHFFQRASREGKPVGQLESPEDQIRFIANMGADDPDALLRKTLKELRDLRKMLDGIKSGWREGSEQRLEEFALRPLMENYPKLYQTLLLARNQQWLPRISAMLETTDTELVLVGALHLIGDHGLLAQLRERGYTVTQMQ